MQRNIFQEYFMTEPELITGRRYPRWRRIAITGCFSFLFILVLSSTLTNAESHPDYRNYNQLTPDEISKKGVLVYKGKSINPSDLDRKSAPTHSYYGVSGQTNDVAQVISRKDSARGDYVLPAGARVAVALDGKLNSELSQSPVIAYVNNGFVFQGRTLVPAGSKILGRVGPGQDSDRISVIFDQIVFPNGHQISAAGYAVMPDGSPGIVGEHHSGRSLKIAGAVGSSFLAGVAAALQTNQVNMLGLEQPKGSTRNAILNGVAQTTLEQGRRFSDEASQTAGFVTVNSGSSFQVYFDREVDLSGASE